MYGSGPNDFRDTIHTMTETHLTVDDSFTMATSKATWTVGSVARVALPDNPKLARRAMIVTVDGSKASILWEERYPNPFSCQPRFVVSPSSLGSGDDTELEVSLDKLLPLLDVEKESVPPLPAVAGETCRRPKKVEKTRVLRWKDRGDQVFKLGDACAALPYYEYALYMTFLTESIGASVLIKKEGFVQVAEVDCVNDDDNVMDITWEESGEEESLPLSGNMLTILEPHCDNIQERILLNLTRCLIQIAETGAERRSAYAKAAALAATMALVLTEYHDKTSDRVITSLLLRAQAQTILQRFSHAQQDLQRIMHNHPQHRQAQQMLRQVMQRQKETEKRDKVLAREVCRWVEASTATATDRSKERDAKPPEQAKQQSADAAGDVTSRLWSYFTCATLE